MTEAKQASQVRSAGVWAVACAVLTVLPAGCANFGAGGTGETQFSQERLRDIDRRNLSDFARPDQPSTLPVEELPTTLPTTAPVETMSLSLDECRAAALKNNLDLAVSRFDPTLADQRLAEQRARFEAAFTMDARYARLDQATASELTSAQGEDSLISPGLRVPLQLGGSLTLTNPMQRSATNNQFATLDPAYTVNPTMQWEQPLLRGFGVAANAQPIRVAFYASQRAEARTKLEVIRVLASVDRIYWRLYAAQKELEVRKREFDVAAALLERNRRRLAAKLDPEVEVLRAESALADRLEAVQVAENQLRQRERDLKRIMNRPDLDIDSPTRLALATDPVTLFQRLDRGELSRLAVTNRMELLETELQILSDTATIQAARNGMLPLAALTYTYRVNGLGSTFDEAFAQVDDTNFQDNIVGVRIEVPIGNEAARARLRQALATRMQTIATKAQRTMQIRQELADALDSLDLSRQNIVAAQRRVILARRVLAAEVRQLDAGLRTSTEVLDAQSRLASALSAEVLAVTNHQISQVDIAFASGLLLGSGNVYWEPVPPEKVGRYLP